MCPKKGHPVMTIPMQQGAKPMGSPIPPNVVHSMDAAFINSKLVPFHKAGECYSKERYAELLTEVIEEITKLGKLKGDEYASGGDRLQNFRDAAKDSEVPMELIWKIYAGKHWDAIKTYVNDLTHDRTRPRMESIKGRAFDLIVYSILFIAMVEEREAVAGKDKTAVNG